MKIDKLLPILLFLLLAPEPGKAHLPEHSLRRQGVSTQESASMHKKTPAPDECSTLPHEYSTLHEENTMSRGNSPLLSDENQIPSDVGPTPSAEKPIPSDVDPTPSAEKPIPSDVDPTPSVEKPIPSDVGPTPSAEKPIPSDVGPTPPHEKPAPPAGSSPLLLTLERTISLAADSSLQAFRNQNLFLAGYWEFRTYRAERLPSLTLNITPAEYYRDITKRYDSENDRDIYRKQQSFYAGGNLQVKQNFDLLGGSFFLDSDLGYMRYFGDDTYTQFTSVPIRIGYAQNLIGYNPFRWQRKIEPLKYEKVKKELLYHIEEVSEQATTYFFGLAMAQAEYDLAKENVASTDTLYRTGRERHKIAAISQADLLTLKLDALNARNTLKNAEIALKRAMFSLASFLDFDKNTQIRLRLPSHPLTMDVPLDEALRAARENNPDYLALRQQILEAERDVDKARKEARFNASVNASIGFNQVADNLKDAYRNPLQQDIVSVSVSIPLVDWGVRKGKYNVAKNNLNVNRISARQEEVSLEEDVTLTVGDFNIQQDLISSAEEALDLAILAYQQTKQRFLIGKADINSLTLSLNRQQEAQRNYISALQNYWLSYYKIRKLTLHDFETGLPLSHKFDYLHHIE